MTSPPASPRRSILQHGCGSAAPHEAWATPITAPAPTPTVLDAPSQEGMCQEVRTLCQEPMIQRDQRPRDNMLWNFLYRCRTRLHLSCILQLRMRCPAPVCIAKVLGRGALFEACQEANLPTVNSWEDLPEQPEHDMFAGMPRKPDHVLGLCCESVGGASKCRWGGKAGGDAMSVAGPFCMMTSNPVLIPMRISPTRCVPSMAPGTLVVDLAHGSRNWVCLPGCTASFDAVNTASSTSSHGFAAMPADVPAYELPRGCGFCSAEPPTHHHDSTNAFVYCPVLLHAADLSHPAAAASWSSATGHRTTQLQ